MMTSKHEPPYTVEIRGRVPNLSYFIRRQQTWRSPCAASQWHSRWVGTAFVYPSTKADGAIWSLSSLNLGEPGQLGSEASFKGQHKLIVCEGVGYLLPIPPSLSMCAAYNLKVECSAASAVFT